MSAVAAFTERLAKTKQEITKVTADLEAPQKARENVLTMGEAAKAVDANHRVKALQEQLEDLTITRAALEGKLRFYKHNEPEAATVREQVATLWASLEMAPVVIQEWARGGNRLWTLNDSSPGL